jgi:hypothetical protein
MRVTRDDSDTSFTSTFLVLASTRGFSLDDGLDEDEDDDDESEFDDEDEEESDEDDEDEDEDEDEPETWQVAPERRDSAKVRGSLTFQLCTA